MRMTSVLYWINTIGGAIVSAILVSAGMAIAAAVWGAVSGFGLCALLCHHYHINGGAK